MRRSRLFCPATVLALLAAVTLAACGSGSSSQPTTTTGAGAPDSGAAGGGFRGEDQLTTSGVPPAALIAADERRSPAGYRFAITHGARIVPDPQSGSFIVASTTPQRPRAMIVQIHGHDTSVFTEYKGWQPYAARHGYGLAVVEYQTHFYSNTSFLSTQTVYGMIQRAVAAQGVAPGHVLLHGFSQGSHEVFGLTELDRAQARLVGVTLAESGGARNLGTVPAFAGTHWIFYCAGRDPFVGLTDCGTMHRVAASLQSDGAHIDAFLFNPTGGHGSFLHDPPLVEQALAVFARVVGIRP